jgi:hypothetical protein
MEGVLMAPLRFMDSILAEEQAQENQLIASQQQYRNIYMNGRRIQVPIGPPPPPTEDEIYHRDYADAFRALSEEFPGARL